MQTKLIWLILMSLALATGCNREIEQTPEATQTPPPLPLNITYCDIAPSDLCLEGFGQAGEDEMLILFKADDRSFADIYVRVDQPEGEVAFECQQSQDFPENVYCLGAAFPDEARIKLDIYSKSDESLIAIGVFIVQYSGITAPDVDFGIETPEATATGSTPAPTSTPEPNYPNYPNYPNPSFPNSTSTP
jgi:hypothetical protein